MLLAVYLPIILHFLQALSILIADTNRNAKKNSINICDKFTKVEKPFMLQFLIYELQVPESDRSSYSEELIDTKALLGYDAFFKLLTKTNLDLAMLQ